MWGEGHKNIGNDPSFLKVQYLVQSQLCDEIQAVSDNKHLCCTPWVTRRYEQKKI